MDDNPTQRLGQTEAITLFTMLAGLGYACSIKHLRTHYYIEVPVRLRGDKAYGAEAEIANLVYRAGYDTVQTGRTLRIIGK